MNPITWPYAAQLATVLILLAAVAAIVAKAPDLMTLIFVQ